MNAMYFSNVPQKSWGENLYKVKIITQNPIIWDMENTRFNSLTVQDAFDGLFRGITGYIQKDLVDYQNMDENRAWKLVENWSKKSDLLILKNCIYAKHTIEYIVPSPEYNGHSAKIIILERTVVQTDYKNDTENDIDLQKDNLQKDNLQTYIDELYNFWTNIKQPYDISELKDIV